MKKIKIKISQLKLRDHPKIMELTDRDIPNPKAPPNINQLSESQVSILLGNIVLNVIVSTDGEYLLLVPNVMYYLLESHPAANNMSVSLLIHAPRNEDEFVELIEVPFDIVKIYGYLKPETLGVMYER